MINLLYYKEVVNFIYVDEDISFCFSTDQCDNGNTFFYDPHHHEHIITGDSQVVIILQINKASNKGSQL